MPIDANVEAFDELLDARAMGRLRDRLEERLAHLDGQPLLGHADQLEYAALVNARADAHAVPNGIDEAKAILRDEARFFDPEAYASATLTVDAALRVVSATHHPLHLDFTAYRTPFGLTSIDEVERSAEPNADPFDAYVQGSLLPKLIAANVRVVGLSVCFPGQLQPAYAFAAKIKRALPHVHLTCGGPGITQMMIRLRGQRLAHALGPFDSACLFEGERTLLALVRRLADNQGLRDVPNLVLRDRLMGARWLAAHGMEDLKALPPPDFDGLPFGRYLAPHVVLPYDPTRGCYWGKCTFCHYGLAEVGTATYRERDVTTAISHLSGLKEKHGTHRFYFSQDSVAPKTLLRLSQAMIDQGLELRWATDLKPEKYLTAERAEVLRKAGAVACALGVESASPRVLELIDKGAPIEVVGDVIDRLAGTGIAAEAMCFTDFPTERHDDALATLDFLHDRRDRVAVFIVGEFGLTHGSLVAQSPESFDIAETWELDGDELGLGIFFAPTRPWKTPEERAAFDDALADLSSGWVLRTYPWAGAVSTAHTILHYERFGAGVFREHASLGADHGAVLGSTAFSSELRFDPRAAALAGEREAETWGTLVNDRRCVSRSAYESLTAEMPPLMRHHEGRLRLEFRTGAEPSPIPARRRRRAPRRPSHAPNATRV
jgi:hypothetical protein